MNGFSSEVQLIRLCATCRDPSRRSSTPASTDMILYSSGCLLKGCFVCQSNFTFMKRRTSAARTAMLVRVELR